MKNFDEWNKVKKKVEDKEPKNYKERDIWWSYVGINIGNEQNGSHDTFQRPVLVLKGISRSTCFVVPLTTSKKEHISRIDIGIVDGKNAKVILTQVKLMDTKRLMTKIGPLDKVKFEYIRKRIRSFF